MASRLSSDCCTLKEPPGHPQGSRAAGRQRPPSPSRPPGLLRWAAEGGPQSPEASVPAWLPVALSGFFLHRCCSPPPRRWQSPAAVSRWLPGAARGRVGAARLGPPAPLPSRGDLWRPPLSAGSLPCLWVRVLGGSAGAPQVAGGPLLTWSGWAGRPGRTRQWPLARARVCPCAGAASPL